MGVFLIIIRDIFENTLLAPIREVHYYTSQFISQLNFARCGGFGGKTEIIYFFQNQ